LTGRGADPVLAARADFVTECQEVKHPFRNNIPAKASIEY
jgi:cob(I)alamin adenosyltransferase